MASFEINKKRVDGHASQRCTVQQGKSEFSNWLRVEGIKEDLIDLILWNLSQASVMANELGISYSSLYTLCDSSEVSRILGKLSGTAEFLEFMETSKYAEFAIREYRTFRFRTKPKKSKLVVIVEPPSESEDIEKDKYSLGTDLFINYCLEKGRSALEADELLKALKAMSQYATEHGHAPEELLKIEDPDLLLDISYKIHTDPVFKKRSAQINERLSLALREYIICRRKDAKRQK